MDCKILARMKSRSRSSITRLARGRSRQAWLVLALLALAAPPGVEAAAAARVESVQVPAWMVRNGNRLPVNAGLPLEAGDIVTTGPKGRLLLRLAEGSLVKLGPDAELQLKAWILLRRPVRPCRGC